MTYTTRRSVLVGMAALATSPLLAAKLPLLPHDAARDGVTLSIRDMTPRFLDFYAAAQGLDPEARYLVWKDRYSFAAVPPGPQGDAVARRLLDAAWPRYADALQVIRAGAAGMTPAPLDTAIQVADLFRAPRPLHLGIVAYVGGFEDNAFSMGTADGPVVCLPVEMSPERRAMLLPHEMTHAVHMRLANLPASYERPLGRVLFEEGIAMHAVHALRPGLPAWNYVGDRPWFEAAMAKQRAILAAVGPQLDASDGPTLFKYTMGQGASGREREAYIAGWLVVGQMLRHGETLAALARLSANQMVEKVRTAMMQL